MHVHAILASKGSGIATIRPDETIAAASRMLSELRIGALVVTSDGSMPDGILSERDIARAVADPGGAIGELPVSALMSSSVITCAPGDDIATLMSVMTELRIRHLPVINGGRMVGIVSIGDVVKARLEEIEHDAEVLREYIATA
jgi:CBS domain-containing protein